MEAGLNADTGERAQGGLAFGRQIFVGMGGDWGQLTLGRHYTTFHTSLASYALTGLIWGNAANYFRDGTVLRADNSLRFQSASMAGLVVRGMYSFGENAGTNAGRQFGGSLDYTRGPWSLGASLWERRTTAQNTDRYRLLGGSYDFKVARAALLLSTREDDLDCVLVILGNLVTAFADELFCLINNVFSFVLSVNCLTALFVLCGKLFSFLNSLVDIFLAH